MPECIHLSTNVSIYVRKPSLKSLKGKQLPQQQQQQKNDVFLDSAFSL